MKTTTERAANVVKLSKGTSWVRFELPRRAQAALLENSDGEYGTVGLTEARERVATLVSAGWRVETAR